MRFVLAAAVVCFAGNVHAKEAHDGLYLRGQFGLGGAIAINQLYDNPNAKVSYHGGAGWLNLEVGGALKAPLILFAKGYHLRAPEPNLKIGGFDFHTDNLGYMSGLGGGVTYYFMPSNFYITAAMCLAIMGIRDDQGNRFETGVGFTTHAGAGIEFFTSSDLALGVGAEIASGFFPDKISTDRVFWSTGFAGVTVNATYN